MKPAALVKKARDLEGTLAVWLYLRERMDMELVPIDEGSAPKVRVSATTEQIEMVMDEVDNLIHSMTQELEKLLGS